MWAKLFGVKSAGHRLRRSERFSTRGHGLRTHLGDVVDLSAIGMRVRSDERPGADSGDLLHLGIDNGSQTVRLAGRVVWVRRVSGAWQVGVEFINVKPGVAAALTQLAKYGFINTSQAGVAASAAPDGSSGCECRPRPQPPVRALVEIEDLYAVLGVPRTAGDAEIRAAYHKLARTHHPDVNHSPGSEERFALISKSWSVLRNPTLRARYDAMLKSAA